MYFGFQPWFLVCCFHPKTEILTVPSFSVAVKVLSDLPCLIVGPKTHITPEVLCFTLQGRDAEEPWKTLLAFPNQSISKTAQSP